MAVSRHDNDIERQAIQAAKYKYILGWKQKDIAKEMEISEPAVAGILDYARTNDIVTFAISGSDRNTLINKIKSKFNHLNEIRIVNNDYHFGRTGIDLKHKIAEEGAYYFIENQKDIRTFGVSCGSTVWEFSKYLIDASEKGWLADIKREIYPLQILLLPHIINYVPSAMVSTLVNKIPNSVGQIYHLPSEINGLNAEAPSDFYMNNSSEIRRFIEKLKNLDCYFMSVGSTEVIDNNTLDGDAQSKREFGGLINQLNLASALDMSDTAGELLYQIFDENGNSLMKTGDFNRLRTSLLYAKLSHLRRNVEESRARVVCMAGGEKKVRPLLGALRGRFFNVLVTDMNTAISLAEELI